MQSNTINLEISEHFAKATRKYDMLEYSVTFLEFDNKTFSLDKHVGNSIFIIKDGYGDIEGVYADAGDAVQELISKNDSGTAQYSLHLVKVLHS